MTAAIIGNGGRGKAVCKLRVAHVPAAQVRALKCVVRQNEPVGDVGARADIQSLGIDDAFTGKSTCVKQVGVQFTAQHRVRLGAADACEYAREIRLSDGGKLIVHAGVDNAVSGDDAGVFTVELRRIQWVRYRTDKLAERVRRGVRVTVVLG